MVHGIVIIFLLLSALFAFAHLVATTASLYWLHWWFDIMMHFWGGILIGLGLHSLATFQFINIKLSWKLVLITLLVATISWEVFERVAGIAYDPELYVVDTAQDMLLGISGGLLAHLVLRTYRMK